MKTEKECKGCLKNRHIENFVTVYGYTNPRGKYCFSCFQKHQQDHASSLMDGRDFCLYCGEKVLQAYDWEKDGRSKKCYLHQDHMDPLALGGADDETNTVYCCVSCNLNKSSMLFVDWLKQLEPQMRQIACEVYVRKHGSKPEEFVTSNNKTTITIDLNDLFDKL